MAEIPWWAWLGVGLFVAISSARIGGSLTLFAWVGLLFIVVGIAKMIYLFVISPRETKQEQRMTQQYQTPYQRQSYCPRCRMVVSPHDNYCRTCGQRLR